MARYFPEGVIPRAKDFGRRIRKRGDEFVQKVLNSRNSFNGLGQNRYLYTDNFPCVGACLDDNGNPVWVNFTKDELTPEDLNGVISYIDHNYLNRHGYNEVSYEKVASDPLMYVDDENKAVSMLARKLVSDNEELPFGYKYQMVGKDGNVTRRVYFSNYMDLGNSSNNIYQGSELPFHPESKNDWSFTKDNAMRFINEGYHKPIQMSKDHKRQWFSGNVAKNMYRDEFIENLGGSRYWSKHPEKRDRLEVPESVEIYYDNDKNKSRFMLQSQKDVDNKRYHRGWQEEDEIMKMDVDDETKQKLLKEAKFRNRYRYSSDAGLLDALESMDTTPFDAKFSNPEYIQRLHEKTRSNGGK